MASNADIYKQGIDALTKGDWKTYRALFTEDVVYEEEATHRRIHGADQYVELVKAWKGAFPDLRGTIKQIVASGDAVVAEIEWEGTHKGPLSGPFGTVAPTGRTGKTHAVVVTRFENGRIRESRHYFDLMTLLAQLGVQPQAAPQPGAR
jgi:steroid delta-isomerase-like uncharacterized protein